MELREQEICQYLLKPSAARSSSISSDNLIDPDKDDIRIEKMLRTVPASSYPDIHQLINIVPSSSSSSSSSSASSYPYSAPFVEPLSTSTDRVPLDFIPTRESTQYRDGGDENESKDNDINNLTFLSSDDVLLIIFPNRVLLIVYPNLSFFSTIRCAFSDTSKLKSRGADAAGTPIGVGKSDYELLSIRGTNKACTAFSESVHKIT